jgi:uncharacterized protein
MPDEVLEAAIRQQIECAPDGVIPFAWHGGEPALYGLDGFRRIVALEKRHSPRGREIHNGIQTNGLLLDEEWCRFLADEGFRVGLSLDGPARFHDLYRVAPGGGGTHALVMAACERLGRRGVPVEALPSSIRATPLFPWRSTIFLWTRGSGTSPFCPWWSRSPRGG